MKIRSIVSYETPMRSIARHARARHLPPSVVFLAVAIAIVLLWSAPAYAQSCPLNPVNPGSYLINVHIQGFPDFGGNFFPLCFLWGPSPSSTGQGVSRELTFIGATNNAVADLMTAAQSKQLFSAAELQQFPLTLGAPINVDIQMTNVRIESVRIAGDSQGPEMIVTLEFDGVVFTFQPLLSNGQKNGPPVTFSATFKK